MMEIVQCLLLITGITVLLILIGLARHKKRLDKNNPIESLTEHLRKNGLHLEVQDLRTDEQKELDKNKRTRTMGLADIIQQERRNQPQAFIRTTEDDEQA